MFHLGDCLEGMKKLDDRSIDSVVTSPPYNLNIKYSKYKFNYTLEWIINFELLNFK